MSKWTPEQEAAIMTRGCELLVSAAAGAGKTAVLVERVIRRLLDEEEPLEINRLLVVTFTNAAAREMKERIGAALTERLRKNPGDRRLKRQLLLLDQASISTLHAFCLELIRQNYYRLVLPQGLALDPRFRVADDVETALIRLETLEGLFEDKYNAPDPLFLQLVDSFGGDRDDRTLTEMVLKLHEFSHSHPEPQGWLAEAARTFRAGLGDGSVERLFVNAAESIVLSLDEALGLMQEARGLALEPGGPAVYAENLDAEIELIKRALAEGGSDWERLGEALGQISFGRLKTCRDKEVDEGIKEGVQTLRNSVKKTVAQLQKDYMSRTRAEYLAEMQEMAPLMEALGHLTGEFAERYLREKLKRNIVDFSDIEHFALKLFEDEELAGLIGRRYAEVLIDEYQDINNVQETLLARVAGRGAGERKDSGKLFMVGDVKQSIYGFRLAEPALFLRKYESFAKDNNAAQRKIILARNFRSRRGIVDAINFIFRQLMSEKLGGLPYDSDAELVCGAEYPPWPDEAAGDCNDSGAAKRAVEVYLLERNQASHGKRSYREGNRSQGNGNGSSGAGDNKNGGYSSNAAAVNYDDYTDETLFQYREKLTPDRNEAADEWDSGAEADQADLDAAQMEARVIGARIRELSESMVWDKGSGTYRPARYQDMVVLMRSTRGTALVFAEEFRRMGIPVYTETGTGYLGAEEVQTMLALLKVIDNPHQDIPLIATLRSAVLGLSAAELASIRLCRREGDFYDALRAAAWKTRKKGAGGLPPGQLRGFLKKLHNWRTAARRASVAELVWLLFRETGYYDSAGAFPEGKQKQANLRALHDRAKQYENTTLKGLFKFLRFLEKIGESGSDLGAARALGEKEDVVRVMSIHKSKGLEFPIVFLAGLGRRFNQSDLKEDILLDKELGFGPFWVDAERRLKYPTLARIAVRNKLKRELLAEEARILYVAMTRARESLILVGTVRNLPDKVENWRRAEQNGAWELTPRIIRQAACFFDWLGPCLMRHRDGKYYWETAAAGEAGRSVCLKVPMAAAGDTENSARLEGSVAAADPSRWQLYFWDRSDLEEYEAKPREDYTAELQSVRLLQPVAERKKPDSAKDILDISNLPENISKLGQEKDGEDGKNICGHKKFVRQRLGWKYDLSALSDIPAKLSVTEIKNRYRQYDQDDLSSRAFDDFAPLTRQAQFSQTQRGMSAVAKGSVMHIVMRHLPLRQGYNEQTVREEVEGLIPRELISREQADSVDALAIAVFLNSGLGERLIKSGEVLREAPFTLALPASELFSDLQDLPSSEKIIVQGTIDCLFASGGGDADGYVLIDYKTDRIERGRAEILKERYRVQLTLYARAVETVLKKPVTEKYLYSFALGEAIRLE